MSVLLDILVIAVIGLFCFFGFRKGIVRSIVSIIGTLAVSAVAVLFSDPIAEGIFRTVLEPSLEEKVENSLKLAEQSGASATSVLSSLENSLPSYITDSMFNFGVTDKELSSALSNGAQAVTTLLEPVVVSFISAVVSVIIFVVLSVLVRIISRFICRAVDSSPVGTLNKVVGAVMGIVEGFVIVFVIMFIIRIAVPHMANVPEIISDETISETTVFKALYDNDLLISAVSSTESPNTESVG